MKKNMPPIKSKIIIFIVFLTILTISKGAMSSRNNSGDSIDIAGMAEESKKQRLELMEDNRAVYRDEMERMYTNGLLFEDLDEVNLRLNRELEDDIERAIGRNAQAPFFIKSKTVFYNASLKQVKEQGLTLSDILADPADHIRDFRVYVCQFGEDYALYGKVHDYWMNLIKEGLIESHQDLIELGFDSKALRVKSKEEWANSENFLCDMRQYHATLAHGNETFFSSITKEELSELKKKYGEEFYYTFERGQDGHDVYAPVRDNSITFTKIITKDKYLTVIAQEYMYNAVEAILKEEGLADRIAHITFPRSSFNISSDTISCSAISIKTEQDKKNFLNDVYIGDYNINLIYLQEENEVVDYDALKRIAERVLNIINRQAKGGKEADERDDLYVHFYTVSKEDRAVVKALFERDKITESYFREETLANMFTDMWLTRTETDGFHYLDVYGDRADFGLRGGGEIDETTTTQEFYDKYSDWYEDEFGLNGIYY